MTLYHFATQKSIGISGERRLDAYFATWYAITPATDDEQRRGIDRTFRCRRFGTTVTVEYKTDYTAGRTGNAFIETRVGERRGWAYTAQAAFIVYYVPGLQRVYVIDVLLLRQRLPLWAQTCRTRRVPNDRYCAEGLLVPLGELARVAVSQEMVEA